MNFLRLIEENRRMTKIWKELGITHFNCIKLEEVHIEWKSECVRFLYVLMMLH